jgi:predicted regulator of amino acid metabolism with ACT domain
MDSRKVYLNQLAEDYGIDRRTVYMLANMLGESEDYDGLICELEDYSEAHME